MWYYIRKVKKKWLFIIAILVITILYIIFNGQRTDVNGKVVICIPVYGQSLALGEEAERITDFSVYTKNTLNRVVTENIDDRFGYFDPSSFKQQIKKLIHYRKRSFELSIYAMAEALVQQLGADTIICTFPGGQGATSIANLSKGTPPYKRFIADIEKAYRLSIEGGAKFYLPAICWMQGESDIVDYPNTNYKELIQKFLLDINNDVQSITNQKEKIRFIIYQPNSLSRAERFKANAFHCIETNTPQAFVELLRNDTLFWASGPTYPYNVVREVVHIDGFGQQQIGCLAAQAAIGILRHESRIKGLLPQNFEVIDNQIVIHFDVPNPPLVFDTIQVTKATNYGFSVITENDTDIITSVSIDSCSVILTCSSSPIGCMVRYAVNGDYMKSGNLHGPRGNLRDTQGTKITNHIAGRTYPLHNWCYQFSEAITQ